MGEGINSGAPDLSRFVTRDDLPPTSYVTPGVIALADLLAGYPASASTVGKCARVGDLFGTTDEVMRCGKTGNSYYWRPQRTDYAATVTTAGGVLTYKPLLMAPSLVLAGSLSSNLTINLSLDNAWPGEPCEIISNLVLGLNTVTLTGLVGAATKALGLNARTSFRVVDGAWQNFQ